MKSRELIAMLKQDGWYLVAVNGSHHNFKHPTKKGKITVLHPKDHIPIGTLNSVLKQASLK